MNHFIANSINPAAVGSIMNRDPSEFNEAGERPDMGTIDRLPEVIREIITDNWTRELPRTEKGFIRQASQLSAVALVALLREGRLSALLGDMGTMDSNLCKLIVSEIICAPNPLLTAQCCDIVFSLKITGRTQEDLSREHGVTKGLVSAICTALKDTHTGKPGDGMKSNLAVKKYKAGRMGKAAKNGAPFRYMDRVALKLAI